MTRKTSFATRHELTLSAAEVRTLDQHARSHYDGLCRSLADLGGLIHGLVVRAALGDEIVVDLENADVDLICKVLENPRTQEGEILGSEFRAALFDRPLETFLTELAVTVVRAENERDLEDAAASIAEFMESHRIDAKRLRAFLDAEADR